MTFNEYYQRTVVNKKQGSRKLERRCQKCGYEWRGYAAEKCEMCKREK